MITNKIKALFQFIEYLYSKIDDFNNYNALINDITVLISEKNKLQPRNNYKDKLQSDKIQAEVKKKFNILQDNTANLIRAKATDLNVCNFNTEPIYSFNGIENEIQLLKENFSDKDLIELFKARSLYLEYRSKTDRTFLSMEMFFNALDEIAISLFEYFTDSDKNEFEELKINSQAIQRSEIIDWLTVFDSIDIEEPQKVKTHIISTVQQKKTYFKKQSYNLTMKYLIRFKQETLFFNPKRKLDYINALKIEIPKVGRTESSTLNHTVFEAQNNYYEFLLKYKSLLEAELPQKVISQQTKQKANQPQQFEELFYNNELVTPCIDILKELNPPVINSNSGYVRGKLKGAFVVWIDEMERQSIIKRVTDRKLFSVLLPQVIGDFSINESMFAKPTPRAEENYRYDIKTKLSEIKLSQDSH